MASDIAKLLNSTKSDTEKLNALLHEYLLTTDDNSDNSDGEVNADVETDEETDDEMDMRKSDYEHVIDHAMAADEIVVTEKEELTKAKNFRYFFICFAVYSVMKPCCFLPSWAGLQSLPVANRSLSVYCLHHPVK